MVKKLFKHEFMAYARIMVFVYGILLAVATGGRLIQFFENDSVVYRIFNVFSVLTYGFTIYAVLLFLAGFTVVRFYKNLFTYEGYLSFTLPVTTTQQVGVKLLTTLCFEGITWGVIFLSGCIYTAGELLVEIFKALGYLVEQCLRFAPFQTVMITFEVVLLSFFATALGILTYYLCISIGQLFKKLRILASVGAYFALSVTVEFLYITFNILFSVFAATPAFLNVITFIAHHPFLSIHIGLWVGIVLVGALAAVCFVVIRHIITRKLNLE